MDRGAAANVNVGSRGRVTVPRKGPALWALGVSGYVSTKRERSCRACGGTIPAKRPYLVARGSTFCYACQGAALEAAEGPPVSANFRPDGTEKKRGRPRSEWRQAMEEAGISRRLERKAKALAAVPEEEFEEAIEEWRRRAEATGRVTTRLLPPENEVRQGRRLLSCPHCGEALVGRQGEAVEPEYREVTP